MPPEIWWTSIGVMASLFLYLALIGQLWFLSDRRQSRPKHRQDRPSSQLSAQFRAVSEFLQRSGDLDTPRGRHSAP
jgi:hypothetical protein